MSELRRSQGNIKLILVAVITLVTIVSVMLIHTRIEDKQLADQTEFSISLNTKEVADTIDASVGYALNSIKVTSVGITNVMIDR